MLLILNGKLSLRTLDHNQGTVRFGRESRPSAAVAIDIHDSDCSNNLIWQSWRWTMVCTANGAICRALRGGWLNIHDKRESISIQNHEWALAHEWFWMDMLSSLEWILPSAEQSSTYRHYFMKSGSPLWTWVVLRLIRHLCQKFPWFIFHGLCLHPWTWPHRLRPPETHLMVPYLLSETMN